MPYSFFKGGFMFRKTKFALTVSALLLSTAVQAQISSTDMDKISYCYGVYSASKNKSEVIKNNRILTNAGNLYEKLTNTPSFHQGLDQAPKLDKKQKSACYLMVYGFLGVGYTTMGQTDSKSDWDLAYCMGYVNQAREVSDSEMVQEFCDTEKDLSISEKKQCVLELTQITKQNCHICSLVKL